MLSIILCSTAAFFIAVHLATLALAFARCRPSTPTIPGDAPPVTLVRPLCGLETFSARTLHASFTLDYPCLELLFCVARADDPIVPLARAAMAAHPHVPARLLIGDDPISANPKLNNMVKGWREASHPWIAYVDSNVLMPPDFVARVMAAWRPDTGAVAAPPAGCLPDGFGGHLECAFLNTYEARWQYAVAALGHGYAQGKTLLYRKADLDRTGMLELAREPAEDAATTKMVRRMGLRVRLAPPSPQPLGTRPLKEVWGRQLRWARLRRATFPVEFLPEILSGALVPALAVVGAAGALGWPVGGHAAGVFRGVVRRRGGAGRRLPLAARLAHALRPAGPRRADAGPVGRSLHRPLVHLEGHGDADGAPARRPMTDVDATPFVIPGRRGRTRTPGAARRPALEGG